MTRRRRGLAPFVLLVVGALLLPGCGEERESERLPRTQASASSSSGDERETAEKQADYRVYQLIASRNTIRQQPGTYRDTSAIGFADDALATRIIAESLELEDRGRKQRGKAVLTGETRVLETDLNPPRKAGQPVAPYVSLRGCVDASGTHLVDAKGAKVKGSEGTGPRPVEFHVINRQWPSSETWRVAWEKPLRGSC